MSSTVPDDAFRHVVPPKDAEFTMVARFLARTDFSKHMSNLLVMASLARLGGVEVLGSVLVQDGNRLDFDGVPRMDAYCLQRAAMLAKRMGWPPLGDLEIQTAWQWLNRVDPMMDSFDGKPIGRALAAFSRIFDQKTLDEPMQLLWALIGIEALYSKGSLGIGQQVREKAQVFLGPQKGFKSKLKTMYDFRSRFVHGDLDFPGLSLLRDARDAAAKYDRELLEAITIAVALLAATLQEVIRRGWNGLDFEYTVSDVP